MRTAFRPRRLFRWATAAMAVAAVTALAPPAQAAQTGRTARTALAHDPVLFVHGINENSLLWLTMIDRLKRDGWTDGELFNWDFNYFESSVKTAGDIRAKVDDILAETGASKVDIVSHSLGGVNSRWYVKFLGGTSKVDDWFSIAGANHGSRTAAVCAPLVVSCREILPGSELLTTLNAGDETPGGVRYGTLRSDGDLFISPIESTVLDGAENYKAESPIGHIALTQSAEVYPIIRDFIR
ncbi:esterase/lipase family protein [Actinomadura sp. 9N215]|uniref:esterase/lipase family protein n=1 Tax=Actinomadura sp. 9N215 TaxID=3375150 RepID=UPI0037A79520